MPPYPVPPAMAPAYPYPSVGAPGTAWPPALVPPPPSAPPYPASTPPLAAPAPRRRWPRLVALAALLVVLVAQSVYLAHLDSRLSAANRQHAASTVRIDELSDQVKKLRQGAAESLDTEAVASAVLPSVFRVDAGDFSGTAFAIGKKPAGGGTDLLTNYHVVEEVYSHGARNVSLQHDSQRFPAQISRVDKDADLALLHTSANFPRLVAGGEVTSGVPILVVGAPLRLAQSVTNGIVSAVRTDVPGESGKTLIQFSAPINPGNSGGPVVDAQKRVVGIATAKADGAEGIGLAIPIQVACDAFAVC
jgi:putative serine protease PepD